MFCSLYVNYLYDVAVGSTWGAKVQVTYEREHIGLWNLQLIRFARLAVQCPIAD